LLFALLWLWPLHSQSQETYIIDGDNRAGTDWTTLQAAETATNDMSYSGRGIVQFQCRDSVTNIAAVTVDGGSNQDNDNHLEIVPVSGQMQTGVLGSAGAWVYAAGTTFTINDPSVVVSGMLSEASGAPGSFSISLGAHNITIADCMLVLTNGFNGLGGIGSANSVDATNSVVRNCVFYDASPLSGPGIQIGRIPPAAGSNQYGGFIYNNTMRGSSIGVYGLDGITGTSTGVCDLVVENNISVECDTLDFSNAISLGSITMNNDYSSDASADDWGGANHQINQNGTNTFKAVDSDHNLLVTANAIEGGKTLTSFAIDILGTSRPQSNAWDQGSFEYPFAAPPTPVTWVNWILNTL
jgi:hypothetical protein